MRKFDIIFEEVMKSLDDSVYYHVSPKRFDKFDLSFVGSGMSTGFYGYGIYLAKSLSTIEYYASQMKDEYDKLYCYTVNVSGNFKNEDEEIEYEGTRKSIGEIYNDLQEAGVNDKEISLKLLNDYGIDGIKYYNIEDGASLVVFNADCITIKKVEDVEDIEDFI